MGICGGKEMTKWKCNKCDPACVLTADNNIPAVCPYGFPARDMDWHRVAKTVAKSAKKPKRSPVKKVENPVKKYLFV
jgi:hypothetical protein